MTRRAIAVFAILSVAAAGGEALANPVEEEARRLFDEATVALQTGRVAEARDLLRRSLTLYPNVAAAFNLAVALRGTGQTVESVELFDAILAGRHGPLAPEQTAEATRLRAEAAREIARIVVGVTGAERTAIRVDGDAAASVAAGDAAEIAVDAGTHEIVASAPGRVSVRRMVRLDRGEREPLSVHLEVAGPHGTLVVEAAEPGEVIEIVGVGRAVGTLRRTVRAGEYLVRAGDAEERVEVPADGTIRLRLGGTNGVLSGPWPWVGLGALVAGAVLVTAVVLTSGGEAGALPEDGYTFGVVEALTSRR